MAEKLINRCRNCLVLNKDFLNKYWVYAVYDVSDNLLFIHYGTYKDIITMRPFISSEKFNSDETYKYVLLNFYNTKIAAENAISMWINNSELEGKTPPYNGFIKQYNSDACIQCVENKRYYRTAIDVAKIFNVAQSALSNHLRGVAGYKSVKGLHFKYYYGDRPNEIEEWGGYKLQRMENGGYARVPSDDPLNNNYSDKEKAIDELRTKGGFVW